MAKKQLTITREDFAKEIAQKTGINKDAVRKILNTALDVIKEKIASNHHIEFRKFATFEVKFRKERIARNPKTNQPLKVPARYTVHFKPGKELKREVIKKHPVR